MSKTQCCSLTTKGKRCKNSSNGKISCSLHSNLEYYDKDDFYLIHSTDVKNIKDIVKIGALLPISETKKKSHYDWEEYNPDYPNLVFTTLIFPLNEEQDSFTHNIQNAYFVFKPEIMELYDNFWCDSVKYGIFREGCLHYDKTKDLTWNLNNIRKTYEVQIKKGKTFFLNEVVFKNKLPLKYLKCIYVSHKNDNYEEIKELSEKYPQYKWVFKKSQIKYT